MNQFILFDNQQKVAYFILIRHLRRRGFNKKESLQKIVNYYKQNFKDFCLDLLKKFHKWGLSSGVEFDEALVESLIEGLIGSVYEKIFYQFFDSKPVSWHDFQTAELIMERLKYQGLVAKYDGQVDKLQKDLMLLSLTIVFKRFIDAPMKFFEGTLDEQAKKTMSKMSNFDNFEKNLWDSTSLTKEDLLSTLRYFMLNKFQMIMNH